MKSFGACRYARNQRRKALQTRGLFRQKIGIECVEIALRERRAVLPLPLHPHPWHFQDGADMIALGNSHGKASLSNSDRHARRGKHLLQRGNRCAAAVIDKSSGPVEISLR